MSIPDRQFNKDVVPRRLVDLRSPSRDRANLLIDLNVMSRQVSSSISKKLSRYKINYNLWQVLVTLWNEHAATPAAVAQHLQVEAATISRYLDQLETLGHITRERSKADRRVVDIELSTKGVKAVEVGLREMDDLSKKLTAKH